MSGRRTYNWVQIDEQSLEAAGFAALHLMATVLMLNDRPKIPKEHAEVEAAEKSAAVI